MFGYLVGPSVVVRGYKRRNVPISVGFVVDVTRGVKPRKFL